MAVHAEYVNGTHIRFTSGPNTLVNAKAPVDGEPAGFNSRELLLVALGNCMLGTFMNHTLLKDARVQSLSAELDATVAKAPDRVDEINVTVRISSSELQARQESLNRIVDSCTIGNTLKRLPRVNVQVEVVPDEVPATT